jgi:hypothetical protein
MKIVGDIHADFNFIAGAIQESKDENIIQLGDFGLGFASYEHDIDSLRWLNSLLEDSKSTLYVIRGNHDNPFFWSSDFILDMETTMGLHHIKLVPDNTIVRIENKTCYMAGGAISIDRTKRKAEISWWPNEVYKFVTPSNTREHGKIDLVFTHNISHKIQPKFSLYSANYLVEHYCKIDSSLFVDMVAEQVQFDMLLDSIVDNSNTDIRWYHGHYHDSVETNVTINNANIRCTSVSINEIVQE